MPDLNAAKHPQHRDPGVQPGRSILKSTSSVSGNSLSTYSTPERSLRSLSERTHRAVPPTRSSLDPRISAPSRTEGTRSAPPIEHIHVPSQSSSRSRPGEADRPDEPSGTQILLHIPADADPQEVEEIAMRIATTLRARRLADSKIGRPSGKADSYPQFSSIKMSQWMAGDHCTSTSSCPAVHSNGRRFFRWSST